VGVDIRFPIGLLFTFIGGALALQGLLGDPSAYARSLGINVNLWWGLVMVVFGAGFLLAGRRR
jgi:hypothetical protein